MLSAAAGHNDGLGGPQRRVYPRGVRVEVPVRVLRGERVRRETCVWGGCGVRDLIDAWGNLDDRSQRAIVLLAAMLCLVVISVAGVR